METELSTFYLGGEYVTKCFSVLKTEEVFFTNAVSACSWHLGSPRLNALFPKCLLCISVTA